MEFLGIPSENLLNRVILIQRITTANNNWIKVTRIRSSWRTYLRLYQKQCVLVCYHLFNKTRIVAIEVMVAQWYDLWPVKQRLVG